MKCLFEGSRFKALKMTGFLNRASSGMLHWVAQLPGVCVHKKNEVSVRYLICQIRCSVYSWHSADRRTIMASGRNRATYQERSRRVAIIPSGRQQSSYARSKPHLWTQIVFRVSVVLPVRKTCWFVTGEVPSAAGESGSSICLLSAVSPCQLLAFKCRLP